MSELECWCIYQEGRGLLPFLCDQSKTGAVQAWHSWHEDDGNYFFGNPYNDAWAYARKHNGYRAVKIRMVPQ